MFVVKLIVAPKYSEDEKPLIKGAFFDLEEAIEKAKALHYALANLNDEQAYICIEITEVKTLGHINEGGDYEPLLSEFN